MHSGSGCMLRSVARGMVKNRSRVSRPFLIGVGSGLGSGVGLGWIFAHTLIPHQEALPVPKAQTASLPQIFAIEVDHLSSVCIHFGLWLLICLNIQILYKQRLVVCRRSNRARQEPSTRAHDTRHSTS